MKFWKEEWASTADLGVATSLLAISEKSRYSIKNNSEYPVYYKPETGKTSIANVVPAGQSRQVLVDGIATCKYPDQVFKIPGKYGISFSVKVEKNGDVLFYDSAGTAIKKAFFDLLPKYTYGWMKRDQFDGDSWDALFDLAQTIKHPN